MNLVKLDAYDYIVFPDKIRILTNGSNDPDIVDIMSEIALADGHIYLDGDYYLYLDMFTIGKNEHGHYMDLQVRLTT